MSQVSRSRVRALERHRRAVARELASLFFAERFGCGVGEASSTRGARWVLGDAYWEDYFNACMTGSKTFDVHAAREHAKTLVALAGEQAVFEDWTRAWGLGPENREPGAFCGAWNDACECPACAGDQGGWPGKLAREWARRQNPSQRQDGPPTSGSLKPQLSSARSAPMGRALARLGLRILDMLEGQASECQGLSGRCKGGHHEHWGSMDPPCPDCHGTGHNLRGVLPPVEWSPALRRKARDTSVAIQDHGGAGHPAPRWLDGAYEAGRESGWTLAHWAPGSEEHGVRYTVETRVCPRGEHRTGPLADRWTPERLIELHPSERPSLDVRVSSRTILAGAHGDGTWASLAKRPRWVRGEAEHARQRRGREARRVEVVVEGGTDEAVSVSVRTLFTV